MSDYDDLFLTEEEKKKKKQQAQKTGDYDDLFSEPESGWDYGGPENPSVPSGSDFAGVKPIEAGTATVGFMGGTAGTTKPSLPPVASREAIAARAREQAAREAAINTLTTVGAVLQPFQVFQDLGNSLVLGYRWATTGNERYLKYAQQGLGQAFGHLTWGAAERIPGLEDLRKNDIYAAKVFEGTSLAKNKGFLLAWDILADPSLLLTLGAGSIKVAANAVGTLSKVERAVVVEKMLATADKMNALSNALTLAPFKASTQLLNTMGSMAVQDVGLLQDVLGNLGKRGAEFNDLERATGGMPTPRYDALSGKSLLEMGGDAVKGALKKTLPTDFPLKSIPLFGPLVQQELTRVAAGKTRVKLYDALLAPEAKYKLYADDPDELVRIMARDRIFLESFDAMDEMRAMKIEAVNKIKPLMDALPASLRPQANEALGRLASSTASTVEEAMLDLGAFFQKADPSIRDGQFLDAFKQMAQVRHDLGVKLREVNQPTVINDDALATVLSAKTLDDVLPSFEMLTSRTIRLRGAEDRAALRGMQQDLLEQTQMVVGMGHAKGAVPASVLAPLKVKQSEKLNNLDDAFLRVLNDIEAKGTDLQKESFLNVAKNYVASRQGIMNNLEGRGIQTASDPTALEILGDAASLSDFAATFRLMVTKQGMEAPWLVRSYFGKSGNPEQLEELREATVKAINTPEGQRVTTVTDELTPSIQQAQKDLELVGPARPTPAALQGEVNTEIPKFGDPRDAVIQGESIDPLFKGAYLDLTPGAEKVSPELMSALRKSGKAEDHAALKELEGMLGSAEYNRLLRERAEVISEGKLSGDELDLALRVKDGQIQKVEKFKDWTPNNDVLEASPGVSSYAKTKGYNGFLGDGGDLRTLKDTAIVDRENFGVTGKLPKPKLPDGIDPKETEVVTRVIKRQARILTDMDRNDLDISLARNGKDVDELRKTYLKYGLTLPPVEYIKDPVTGAVTVAWKNINAAGSLNAPRAAVSLDIPVDDPVVQRFLRESDVDQYVQDNASKLVMGEKKTREVTPRGFDPNIYGDVQTYLREVGRQQQEYDDFFENVFSANSAELADLAARAGVKPGLPDSNKPLRVFGDDTLDHYIPKTTVGYELAGARFVRRVEELGLKASKQEIAEYKRQMAAYNKWMKLKTVQPEELVTHLKDYYTVHPQATVLDGVISLAKNFDFGRKDMLRYLHSVLAAAEKGFEQKFSAFEELGLIAKEGKKLEPSFRGASGTERLRSQGQKLTRLHNQTFKREVDALGLLQKQVDRAGAQYVRAKTVQSWFQFASDTGEYLPAESVKRILTAPEDTLTEAERAIRIEVQGSRVAEAGRTPLASLEGWREVTSEMVQMSGGKFKKGDHVSAEVYNDLLIASATDDVVAQSYLLDQFGGLSRFLRAWKAGALGSIKSVFNETMGNFLNMGLSGYDPLDVIRGVRELNRMNPDELAQLNKGLGGAQLQNVERLASTQYEGMLRQAESWYRADRKQTALGAALDHYLSWFEVMTGANPHALAGTVGGGFGKVSAELMGLGQSYVFRARSWLSDRQRLLLAATVKAKNPGMPIADVVDETNKVLFDYRLAPLYARVLSRTGIRPFASFEAFSGQRLVLLMMQNPAPYVRFHRIPGSVDRYWMQDEEGKERVPAERLTMRGYEKGSVRVFELDNGEAVYFNPQYLDPLGAPNAILDASGTSVGIYDMGPFIGWATAIVNGQGRYGVNPYDEILQGQPGGFREAAQTDPKRAIEIAAQTTLNFINPAFIPGSSKGSKFADSVVHAATLPNDGSIDVSFSKMMVGTMWGREVLKFLKYGPARIVTGGKLRDTSPSPYSVEAQRPSMAALGLSAPTFGVKGLSGDKGDRPPVDLRGEFMPGNYQSRGTQKLLVDQRQAMDELRRLWSNYHRFANPNINSPAAIQREYWETTLKQDRIVNRYLGTVEILLPSKGFLGQQKNLLESIERQAQGQ